MHTEGENLNRACTEKYTSIYTFKQKQIFVNKPCQLIFIKPCERISTKFGALYGIYKGLQKSSSDN